MRLDVKPSMQVSARDLLKAKVYNRDSALLGSVEDVVLDVEEGIIIYVYLCVETEERVVTVPWSAFEVEAGNDLVLDVSVDSLKAASS